MKNKELQQKLTIGVKIMIGDNYAKENPSFQSGQIIELVEGYFDYENGFFTSWETAPSIWSKEDNEFLSIYHLFENDLSDFMDCKIIEQ